MGVATNVTTTYVSGGNGDPVIAFVATANYLLNQEEPPLVVTTSYGLDEAVLTEEIVRYA